MTDRSDFNGADPQDGSGQEGTADRYGWPLHRRLEEFQIRAEAVNLPTHRVVFEGMAQDFPIIRVPLGLPKYRLANGRTVSSQEEYLARHTTLRRDLFDGDPELTDAQTIQHELLLDLANQAELLDYFKSTTHRQVEPILLNDTGYVVNGNRRLAAWRYLFESDSNGYGHFSNIDVVVLPHCEEKELDKIEANYQIQRDIRADYSWDAQANMMLQKRKRDSFSDRQLAALYGMKEADVRELLDMRSYAEEYLSSRGLAHRWSMVSGNEFAFKRLVAARGKLESVGAQELFKQASFALIEKPSEVGGRLYQAIPDIQEFLEPIRAQLLARFPVSADATETGLEDIFGSGEIEAPGLDLPLAAEIQKADNVQEARELIVEVIESQRQLKRDSRTANSLLIAVTNANAALAGPLRRGLSAELSVTGVQVQLNELRAKLETVEAWLQSRA